MCFTQPANNQVLSREPHLVPQAATVFQVRNGCGGPGADAVSCPTNYPFEFEDDYF